jgi:hypothetical protein
MATLYADIWAKGERVEDRAVSPVVKAEYTVVSDGRVHLLRYDYDAEGPGAIRENRILEEGEKTPTSELVWLLFWGCPRWLRYAILAEGGKIWFDGTAEPLEPGALPEN